MLITKSNYVQFNTCPKALWLKKFRNELSQVSDSTQQRLDSGNDVGDLAMGLFGNYIDVTTYDENGKLDLKEMNNLTLKLIDDEKTQVICEGAFFKDDLYCAVDILKKVNGGFELYEVKSSTEVKEYHITDSAFQKYVLTELGYNVLSVNIVTINSSYIRGTELNIQELFKITNVDDLVNEQIKFVDENITKIRELYLSDEPICCLGKQCKSPHECEFMNYCYKDCPTPSVFELTGCRKVYDFYNQGIKTFKDLFNSKHYEKLSDNTKKHILYEITNRGTYVDTEKIKEFLKDIKYPLYLLDFETFQPIVPLFENTKPYSQIPFQYSLHILYESGTLEHKEFLGKEGTNPTLELANSLLNDIPKDSTIMAYNMTFEKKRIQELADMYPNLSDELTNRLNNFIDLMIPFQKKYIYQKEFKGSYSIKYVLPALFPNDDELNYKNLDLIQNGSDAMNSYENLINLPLNEREQIRKALLKYCELDTYAMYKILMKLYEFVK